MAITGKDLLEKSKKKKEEKSVSGEDLINRLKTYQSIDTNGVDQTYIDTFIKDANDFFSSSEKDYSGVGWSTASSLYDSKNTASQDLITRADTIGAWLLKNRNTLNEENYSSLSKALSEYRSGISSVINGFKSNRDFYAQFDTEDAYKAWQAEEDAKQAILNSEDFKHYSDIGANVYNPDIKNVHKESDKIGNVVTFSRKYATELGIGEANGGGGSEYGLKYKYNFMEDDEVNLYNYYLAKYGKEKANEYLASLEDTLDQRHAGTMIQKADDTAMELLFSAMAGIEQAASGFQNIDNFFKGTEGDNRTSAITYAQSGMSANNDGVWRVANDLANTTGNMLPSILVGSFTGGLGGALTMGASASGNAYADMRNRGYTANQARAYAGMVGASEAALSYALGGISKLGGKGINKVAGDLMAKYGTKFTTAIAGIDNAIARIAIKYSGQMLGKMGSEALEEGLQSVLEPMFKTIVTGENLDVDWNEVAYSALLGALSAGFLEGGTTLAGTIYNDVSTTKHGQSLIDSNSVSGLQDLAREMMGVSKETDMLSIQAKTKQTAHNVGELSLSLGKSVNSQNITDVANALVEKGLSQKEAQKVAEKLVNKEELSNKQMSNDAIKAVAEEIVNNPGSAMNERNTKLLTARLGEKNNASETQKSKVAVNKRVDLKDRVSTDGVTKQISTGEAITIDKSNPIAKTKEGKVYFNTNKGVVESSDISYSSMDEGLIYESFVDLNPAFANAIIKNYDGKMPVQKYIQGMREGVVLYGKHNFQGVGKDISNATYFAELSEADQAFALKLGRNYATHEAKVADGPLRRAIKNAAERAKASEGTTDTDGAKRAAKKSTVRFESGVKETKDIKKSVELAKIIARAIGTDIVFYDARVTKDKEGRGANGYYDPDTNTIHLDIQKARSDTHTIAFTLSHELVHWMKKNSATDFNRFAKFLMEQYAGHGINTSELLQKKMLELKTRDADYAFEEMICDACETLLLDSNAVAKLQMLREQDLTLFEKIKLHIRNLLDKIRAEYKKIGYDHTTDEAKALLSMTDVLEQIYEKFEEAMVGAAKNAEVMETLETEAVSVSEDGTIKMQMKQYRETGRSTLLNYLSEQYGNKNADDMIKTIDAIYNTLVEVKDENTALSVFSNWQETDVELDENGHPIFTTSIKNGDYELNQDFSRVCKKRRQLNFVLNMLATDPAFEASKLTKDDIVKINKLIKKHGFEIACALCFVDSKRYRQTEWADSFANTWNDILYAVVKDKSKLTPFNFATENPNTNDDGIDIDTSRPVTYRKWSDGKEKVKERRSFENFELMLEKKEDGKFNEGNANVRAIVRIIKEHPELRHTFRGADIIASDGFDTIQRLAPEIRKILDGWGGTSVPKPSSNDAIYDNSILNIAGYNAKKAFAVGGVRMNSFSDFMAHMFFDYVQAFADLSAKGLPMHSYTKELDFARLFGLTGGKINMSAIAAIRKNATDLKTIRKKVDKAKATEYEKSIAGLDISRLAEKLGKPEGEVTYDDVIQNLDDVDYVWADESIDVQSATLLQSGILYDNLTEGQASYCYELIREGKFEEAFKVAGKENVNKGYAKHLGIITVGVSRAHILKLLRDPTIRMVIPYHKSGLNATVAAALKIAFYDDFTDVQNTTFRQGDTSVGISKDGAKIGGKNLSDFSFYDWFGKTIDGKFYDGKATAAKYLEWCENGTYDSSVGDYVYYFTDGSYILASNLHAKGIEIIPKFSEFASEENYYKVIEDFDCYDTLTGEHSSQEAVDLFSNGLPSDYKNVLVRALEAEQKVSDDFQDHLDNKGLRDEVMEIVKKRGYNPSESKQKDSGIKKQAKKKTAYDEKLDSLIDEKNTIQSRLSELKRAKEKIESSEEYTALIDRIVSDSDMAAAFDAYNEWTSNSKYGEISSEIASLEKRADELSREYNEIIEQGFADEDQAEIEKRGLSESDYYRKKAIKVFGYTPYFYDAGYLLPNGKLLNFSGEKGSHSGSRGQDHRAIETIYAKETRSDAMLRFMSEGNIRVMAETPGLDISSVAEPTAEQYRTIKNFVREYSKEGYMAVDITDRNGNVVGTYSYENNINADRVVNDIKYYFENGTIREQSSLSNFRYQKKNNPSSYAPTFYSQMAKEIDAIKMDKVGAASLINYLKGKGIKHDEIKWSGIETFLEGKKSVTKAELQEFLAGSQLQIEEESAVDEVDGSIVLWQSPQADVKVLYIDGKKEDIFRKNEYGQWVSDEFGDVFFDEQEILDQLKSDYARNVANTKWSDYKLNGGTKYREIVFKMPNSTYSNQAMRTHWGDEGEGVLAHARIQDMPTADGKKMLFIEEIQSDWHNEGHIEGYAESLPPQKEKKLKEIESQEERLIAERNKIMREYRSLPSTENSSKHTELLGEYDKLTERIKGLQDEIFALWGKERTSTFEARPYNPGVPDAPFRTTYHEYVLKRLLRMAAEEGYDSIGWTPAELQSERWSDEYAEGYRIEYDQDIPKFLRKYGKKWGATVGETAIPSYKPRESVYDASKQREYANVDEWQNDVERELKAQGISTKNLWYEATDSHWLACDDVSGVEYARAEIRKHSGSVWSMEITEPMVQSILYEGQPKFQKKKLSNRTILANALETTIDTSTQDGQNQLQKLQEYKSKIDTLEKEEAHLAEVKQQIHDISFTKGSDRSKLPALNDDKIKTQNRIHTLDSQLLRYEAMKPIQEVLVREKEMLREKVEEQAKKNFEAYKEQIQTVHEADIGREREVRREAISREKRRRETAEVAHRWEIAELREKMSNLRKEMANAVGEERQKKREAIDKLRERHAQLVRELMDRHQESTKQGIERRAKTELRGKIKTVVSNLDKLLRNPSKEQHIPISLQLPVAEALDAINMDAMKAGERVAYYNDLIAKSSDPDEIAMLTKKRDFFEYRDANFKERLTALKHAYAEIKNSDDPLIKNAHNEAIEDLIDNTAKEVGNTSLKDMSLEQLDAVYNMYKAILATVRNANKMFKAGRQQTVTDNSNAVKNEVKTVGGHKDRVLKLAKFFKKFGWNMLKPVTAMKVIGSKTFETLFNNVRAGEDTWAVDVNEAKQFYDDASKKYGYTKWDFKKRYTFEDSTGAEFSLSLEQMLSLYAYSKRSQADKHLEDGGFIFDDAIEVIEKNKLGIPLKYEVNDATPYRLKKENLLAIESALTNEQKAFVDEMQTYLSDVMGAKGNEVSLALYDIKLYNEKNYFPLKTSKYFREFDPEKSGTPKIKNSGFSKKTVPQAGNPIVLANFMDVWANHVNDMSMYHAFVLPLEDFMRVYNYSSTAGGYDSVQQAIKNAYGSQANQYIEKLMDDLNGGARVDPSADIINKGLALFKKASVFASLSVVIQQPSAIARAMAYINPKYFATSTPSALNLKKHKSLWEEVKKYAPVAVIKEMGYFDTGVGRSTVEWLKGNQTIKDKMDDVLSKAPAIADELCWVHIWEAVKRETATKSKAQVGSEEFLKECGKRFTEVITNTQVYDSVLSRNAMMRSKDTGMKMATAFMAEPITSVNMVVDGIIQGKRGNKRFTAATIGSVSASIILNSILVSLVYAARDDDEDETYFEKYVGSVTSELLDGFNPLTYVPFVKDVWSVAQGYDVERSDMSVISKLWESVEGLFNEDKSGWERVADTAGAISSLFGIPLKNILRDAEGMYNLTKTLLRGTETTSGGIRDSVKDSFKSTIPLWDRIVGSNSKTDKLYDAIVSGDSAYVKRFKDSYDDETEYVSAVQRAIRDKYADGTLSYNQAVNMLIKHGYMDNDDAYWKLKEWDYYIKNGSTEGYSKYTEFYEAVRTGRNLKTVINEHLTHGADKSDLARQITNYYKPLYKEMTNSERASIKGYLLNAYSLLGYNRTQKSKDIDNWLKD